MRSFLQSAAVAASLLATPSFSAISTYSPLSSSSGPSYSVGVPSDSSISSSSTGSIYLQIRAPTSYTWAAFGIGQQMAGSKIFCMYADGKGNVTVSARRGSGNVQPTNDANLQAGVQLLAGSGIVDGEMRANLKVSSATLLSDKSSTSSPFIAAWYQGSPLNSDSLSASIRQHADDGHRQFTFDLSRAVLSSDANPYVSAASTSTQGPSQTSSTPKATNSGSSNSPDDDDANYGSGVAVGGGNSKLKSYQKAHGSIMATVVVLLFPLGAIFMRLGGGMIGHSALQLFSLIAMIAGFGLGVRLGEMTGLLYNTAHTIFGTIIFSLFLIQPFLGLAHHLLYKRHLTRTPVSHVHIWYGRTIIVLGMINGGLGLQLAGNSKTGEIVYGVVVGVVVLTYVGVVFLKKGRGRKMVEGGKEGGRGEDIALNSRNGNGSEE